MDKRILKKAKTGDSTVDSLVLAYKNNAMGAVFLGGGAHAQAEARLRTAISLTPEGFTYVNCYINLGNLYSQKREYRLAWEAYEEGLKGSRWGGKGGLDLNSIDSDLSADSFDSREAYIAGLMNGGCCLINIGEAEKALELIEKGLLMDPGNVEMRINMGGVMRQLGQREKAVGLAWQFVEKEMGDAFVRKTIDLQSIGEGRGDRDMITPGSSSVETAVEPPEIVDFICVKWGTRYSSDYVNRLYNGVRRNYPHKFRFSCLTENPAGLLPEIRRLNGSTALPGWWSKALVFSQQDLHPLSVYIDLDVVITGDLSFVRDYRGLFAVMGTDGIACEQGNKEGYNTSLVIFRPERFGLLGDQLVEVYSVLTKTVARFDFWTEMVVNNADIIDRVWPGKVVDYLGACKNGLPKDAAVVVFPRNPKPHDCQDEWVKQHWV